MSWTVASQVWCGLRQRKAGLMKGGCRKAVLTQKTKKHLANAEEQLSLGHSVRKSLVRRQPAVTRPEFQDALGLNSQGSCHLNRVGCLCLCIISTLQLISGPPKCLLKFVTQNTWPEKNEMKPICITLIKIIYSLQLERSLSGQEHLMLLQRTGLEYPEPTWQFTAM